MRDKDQKLLWETYQQVNENLGVGELVNAIHGAVEQSNNDPVKFNKTLLLIKDVAEPADWNEAVDVYLRDHGNELDENISKALSISKLETHGAAHGSVDPESVDSSPDYESDHPSTSDQL